MQATLRRCSALERVAKGKLVPTAIFIAMRTITEGVLQLGIDPVPAMQQAGAIDSAIEILTAYETLNAPANASVCVVSFGALMMLEDLLCTGACGEAIVSKLREEDRHMAAVRYALDNNLVNWGSMGFESVTSATVVAATVWGRDEDGFQFKQHDM